MGARLWSIILMDIAVCPYEGCDWYTDLDTIEGRAAALGAHLARAHG